MSESDEALYELIYDDIPESFWKGMAFWEDGPSNLRFGKLDVANRRQVIMLVIRETRRRDAEVKEDIIEKPVEGEIPRKEHRVPLFHWRRRG